MLKIELGVGQRLHEKIRLELSAEVRLKVATRLWDRRIDLLQALHNENYQPQAHCPNCALAMTPLEILKGFNQDPTDFTTACSACGHRFPPKLICFRNTSHIELPFFCPTQTLNQLYRKQGFSPQDLALKFPAIFRAVVIHYGSLKNAFAKIGINYQYLEMPDWKSKVEPFLGQLPDTTIARCVNVSRKVIARMRQKQNIKPFSRRELAEYLAK